MQRPPKTGREHPRHLLLQLVIHGKRVSGVHQLEPRGRGWSDLGHFTMSIGNRVFNCYEHKRLVEPIWDLESNPWDPYALFRYGV